MNVHTFKDVVSSKRSSLANDIDEDEEDVDVAAMADDVDGEEDEGKEKFNEIGEVIEPFNLKNEREQGHFDTNMNFVWRKEREEPDAWLANMDEAAMEKSIGEAAAAMKAKKKIEDDLTGPESKTDKQLKMELLRILRPGETVLSAMQRLGGGKKSRQTMKRRMPTATPATTSTIDKAAINALTELADELISSGLTGLYDMSYEAIHSSLYLWEYQGKDGLVHGPFTSKQMSDWSRCGYFSGTQSVLMRRVGLVEDAVTSSAGINGKRQAPGGSVAVGAGTGSKRRRVGEKDTDERKGTTSQDLLDDLEEDGGDGEGEEGVQEQKSSTLLEAAKSQPAVAAESPWISSDDVDFGVYVDLQDALPNENQTEHVNENDEE